MSSPLPQATPRRVQRIAEAAVERARLSVVPRVRRRAPRVPFVTLVSLVLLGGVVGLLMFNTSMQQNACAAPSLEHRIVKQAFTAATRLDVPPDLPFVPEGAEPAFRAVTRGAEKAVEPELTDNPRAASVRLRAVERIREGVPA